jgi:hypothetical protein
MGLGMSANIRMQMNLQIKNSKILPQIQLAQGKVRLGQVIVRLDCLGLPIFKSKTQKYFLKFNLIKVKLV